MLSLVPALACGLDLPNCGCFGVFWPQRLTPWMLLEDGVLLALSLLLYLGARGRGSPGMLFDRLMLQPS